MYVLVRRDTSPLLWIVIAANVSILAGTQLAGWNPGDVALLFAIDAAIAVVRITFEKSVTAGPPEKSSLHEFSFFMIWDSLIDKRGSYRIPFASLSVYPRNLAYVLRFVINVCVIGAFVVAFTCFGEPAINWPDIGNIDPTIAAIIPLVGLKHGAIVGVWSINGIYERAAIETIRPRERLYAALVGFISVGAALLLPPEILTTTVAAVLGLKFPFDLRESGIGPSILTFDPTCDREEAEYSLPKTRPIEVFRTDRRAVASSTILALTPLFVVLIGPVVAGLVAGVTDIIGLGGVWSWIGVVATTIVMVYSVGLLVAMIEYGDVEYRVYDEILVAYDTGLRTVQWEVPRSKIDSVSVAHSVFTVISPFCGPTVTVEYRGGEPPVDDRYCDLPVERLRYVKDPRGLASTLNQVTVQ